MPAKPLLCPDASVGTAEAARASVCCAVAGGGGCPTGRGVITASDHVGGVPKWTKGTVCKTVIRGFESRRRLALHVVEQG